jgi:CBS domain-containing protein
METVASLPLREAVKVSPSASLRDVVTKLRSNELGCAIVVDIEDKPLGIFTERALMKLLLGGVDLDQASVGEHLDPRFAVVSSSDPIRRVLMEILDGGHRFLAVVDENGRTVGLTGQRGLAEYVSEHYPQQVMVQRLGGSQSLQNREGA